MPSTLCMFYSFYTLVCSQCKLKCWCALSCFGLSLTAAIWNSPWYITFSQKSMTVAAKSPNHTFISKDLNAGKMEARYEFFKIYNFFFGELIQGQTIEWKRNFSFWGSYCGCIISQAWILNSSLMSTRPWVHPHQTPTTPPLLLMHPRHKLRADIGLSIGGVE